MLPICMKYAIFPHMKNKRQTEPDELSVILEKCRDAYILEDGPELDANIDFVITHFSDDIELRGVEIFGNMHIIECTKAEIDNPPFYEYTISAYVGPQTCLLSSIQTCRFISRDEARKRIADFKANCKDVFDL